MMLHGTGEGTEHIWTRQSVTAVTGTLEAQEDWAGGTGLRIGLQGCVPCKRNDIPAKKVVVEDRVPWAYAHVAHVLRTAVHIMTFLSFEQLYLITLC